MNTIDPTAKPVKKVNLRPTDATIEALRGCLRWLDACKELGWLDEQLPNLEALWWKYHDKDGKIL